MNSVSFIFRSFQHSTSKAILFRKTSISVVYAIQLKNIFMFKLCDDNQKVFRFKSDRKKSCVIRLYAFRLTTLSWVFTMSNCFVVLFMMPVHHSIHFLQPSILSFTHTRDHSINSFSFWRYDSTNLSFRIQ